MPTLLLSQGTLTQIPNNGPNDKRINFVILSEGYTISQKYDFNIDAVNLLNYILNKSPYDQYNNYFNAYTIFVSSTDSGSDHPSGEIFVDTYFNSTYDSYGIKRLITIPPNNYDSNYDHGIGKVYDLLQNHLPDYDLIMLIVNDSEYGGSGGNVAITSINSSSFEIMVHELGHSFAKLADEYETPYPSWTPREFPNSTKETHRELIKWNHWILDDTPIPTPELWDYNNVVGLFEGSQYQKYGWYRPRLNCRMRTLNYPFCEVCKEHHIKSIYQIISPIEDYFPNNDVPIIVTENIVDFFIYPMTPSSHDLIIQWIINQDTLWNEKSFTLNLNIENLQIGQNIVEAIIIDTTNIVLDATIQPLLRDSVNWFVNLSTYPAPIANFSADTTFGVKPFTVQFIDGSSGIITNWQWNFGDSQTRTEQNPRHTYEIADTFTVSLTVTGPGGSNIKTQEDFITVVEITNVSDLTNTIPKEYHLYQNYPNPFNSTTNISYALPEVGKISIKIYDLNGKLVKTLVDSKIQAGNHIIFWNVYNLSSGVYFIKYNAVGFKQIKKCILLK